MGMVGHCHIWEVAGGSLPVGRCHTHSIARPASKPHTHTHTHSHAHHTRTSHTHITHAHRTHAHHTLTSHTRTRLPSFRSHLDPLCERLEALKRIDRVREGLHVVSIKRSTERSSNGHQAIIEPSPSTHQAITKHSSSTHQAITKQSSGHERGRAHARACERVAAKRGP
eukprot:1358462-Prymnesium_polylepis.1